MTKITDVIEQLLAIREERGDLQCFGRSDLNVSRVRDESMENLGWDGWDDLHIAVRKHPGGISTVVPVVYFGS